MSGVSLAILCTCRDTLKGTLHWRTIEQEIKARRPMTHVGYLPSLCLYEDLDRVKSLVEQERPRALLIGACSPFAKGRAVLDKLMTVCEASISVTLVDLREGCAWIHTGDPRGASAKAADIVCMGLAELEHRQSVRLERSAPEQRVLVVGAGPAGLAASEILARLGLEVVLAERLERPGGLLNQIGKLFPQNVSSEEFLGSLLKGIDHPATTFLPQTTVSRIDGDPGKFIAHLSRSGDEESLTVGAVILACGALPVFPEGLFRFRALAGVISQMELETKLKKLEADRTSPLEITSAVFIQCVAARDEVRPYCSTICCPTALKNALRLKTLKPDLVVTILHRGIMAPGKALEELYRHAMASGVFFHLYDPAEPPEVAGRERAESVSLIDALSGRRFVFTADLVVLSTPLKPRPGVAGLARDLGMRLDPMGFACGREPMQPLAAPVPGVYLCGAVRWPVPVHEAVDQGRAAAVKAAVFLNGGNTDRKAPGAGKAMVLSEACGGCGWCIAVCPYGACRRAEDGTSVISPLRCQGCGLCAAVCPSGAARLPERSSAALRAMVREIAQRSLP